MKLFVDKYELRKALESINFDDERYDTVKIYSYKEIIKFFPEEKEYTDVCHIKCNYPGELNYEFIIPCKTDACGESNFSIRGLLKYIKKEIKEFIELSNENKFLEDESEFILKISKEYIYNISKFLNNNLWMTKEFNKINFKFTKEYLEIVFTDKNCLVVEKFYMNDNSFLSDKIVDIVLSNSVIYFLKSYNNDIYINVYKDRCFRVISGCNTLYFQKSLKFPNYRNVIPNYNFEFILKDDKSKGTIRDMCECILKNKEGNSSIIFNFCLKRNKLKINPLYFNENINDEELEIKFNILSYIKNMESLEFIKIGFSASYIKQLLQNIDKNLHILGYIEFDKYNGKPDYGAFGFYDSDNPNLENLVMPLSLDL